MSDRQRPKKKPKRKAAIGIFGLILILAGSAALFWNEWRSATATATLIAGERALVDVSLDRVPPEATTGLVHLVGPASPSGPIADPLLPLSHAALRLDRVVEMYQWREFSQGTGDNRTDNYEAVWAEGRIPSERFRDRMRHSNPAAPSIQSARFYPDEVTLGAYAVAPDILDQLRASEGVAVPQGREVFIDGRALRGDGSAFLSGSATHPEIGDLRIRFMAVPVGEISVLAGLDGSTLRPWTAHNGGSIAMAEPGPRTASQLLATAYRSNALTTWLIRAAGWLGIFVGSSILLGHIARRVPPIADLKARLKGPIAATLALAWALAVIALAWVIFRPLLSLGLVAASAILFLGLRALKARRLDEKLAHQQALDD
jgi:hypothetical protein